MKNLRAHEWIRIQPSKKRKGAFWEVSYHATVIEKGVLGTVIGMAYLIQPMQKAARLISGMMWFNQNGHRVKRNIQLV